MKYEQSVMPRARWPPCLKGAAPQAHQAPPRPRQAPLKHLLSTFFCCIDSSNSAQDENATGKLVFIYVLQHKLYFCFFL